VGLALPRRATWSADVTDLSDGSCTGKDQLSPFFMKANIMPIIHHIPVCPFSQRLEILLELKGCHDRVEFRAVDIAQPRSAELLALSAASTALPTLELSGGTVLRESLVILRYLDDLFASMKIAQADPLRLERKQSSFVLQPHWSERPRPPRDKYGFLAIDSQLGLNQARISGSI
jgi:glutathione S-transferase